MKKPADWPSDLCYAAPSTESIYSSYQEDEWWVPDESNGSGELAFVSSTVSARWFVCILGQLQLFQCPLHHLQGVKSNVSRWNSAVQAMKETTVGYPPLNVELHNICWIVPIFDPQFVFSAQHVGSDSDSKYGSFTKWLRNQQKFL